MNQPYIHFKSAIANKLIDAGIFNPDWFILQEERLNRFWLNDESPESAYDVIGAIAEAKFSRDVYRSPSRESLIEAGCVFEYQ